MQILEELWSNDLQMEKPYIHNCQYREALALVTDCETYITGFKLGARIMLDVLTKGEVNKV